MTGGSGTWTGRRMAGLVVLLVAIGAVICWRMIWNDAVLGDDLEITAVDMATAEELIDPNTASWASMARLPGIGPKLSKAIVSHREKVGGERDGSAVFVVLEDLRQVSGIGPATLEGIRPFVTFGVDTGESAGVAGQESK